MSLASVYAENAFVLSYELFPPKTETGMKALAKHLASLLEFNPHFITCTYGAGGTGHDKTLSTLALVGRLCDLPVVSHLTCVGATVGDLREYLRRATEAGISSIVALRGDRPEEGEGVHPAEGGLTHANELVALIRAEFPHFGIAVGGYPETHPEAPSPAADIENLKRKVDCGADVVITQLFYDNDDFYRFREGCVAAGIGVPIVPGILPITSHKQIKRISSLCGAVLPAELSRDLEEQADNLEGQFDVGVRHAMMQVQALLETGVPGVHFYVLNQSRATAAVLNSVDLSSR